MLKSIDLNPEFKKALDLMENTGKNIFITGKAGTGKSTLLEYFRSLTRKKIVVLAPTGVAALNVQGETIHSFFRFKPDITLQKVKKLKKKSRIYLEIDAIIIDEISMARADLIDCVDKFLRLNSKDSALAFGGLQMIFIGDLYQLPPVISAKEKEAFKNHYQNGYFFEALAFKRCKFEFVELEKIYRQKDEKFIELLNAIRNNHVNEAHLLTLNKRVCGNIPQNNGEFFICLTTTNKMAQEINIERLNLLKTKIHSYAAEIDGDFKPSSYPADEELKVAAGSQVMLLNNDRDGRWVNGSIGKAVEIKYSQDMGADIISVESGEGNIEEVAPFEWEIFHFSFNAARRQIESETVGTFSQYPLKLAWAVTIHKSQGKTFDKVIIDMGNGAFACGQTYVALSRCRSLEGIFLKRPIRKSDIRMDFNIVKFLTQHQYSLSERDLPLKEKMLIINNAIKNKSALEITYLKPDDTKSRRFIKPFFLGEREYEGKVFTGVEAYCASKKENRVFRVDRILEMSVVKED